MGLINSRGPLDGDSPLSGRLIPYFILLLIMNALWGFCGAFVGPALCE